MRETKRRPNVDISHLGTKQTNFKFLKIFQNYFENPRKCCEGGYF